MPLTAHGHTVFFTDEDLPENVRTRPEAPAGAVKKDGKVELFGNVIVPRSALPTLDVVLPIPPGFAPGPLSGGDTGWNSWTVVAGPTGTRNSVLMSVYVDAAGLHFYEWTVADATIVGDGPGDEINIGFSGVGWFADEGETLPA